MIKITPNQVTTFRLFLVLPIVFLQQIETWLSLLVCLCLLITNEILDIVDGHLARRYSQISDFGKLYDPLVDFTSHFCFFLAYFASDWGIDLWMLYAIFLREMSVIGIRIYSLTHNFVLAARASGKYLKTTPQAILLCLIVFIHLLEKLEIVLPAKQITWWLMLLVTALTILSALDYYNVIRIKIKKKEF